MRPLLQHASRSLFANVVPQAPQRVSNATFTNFAKKVSKPPSICWSCQFHASSIVHNRNPRPRGLLSFGIAFHRPTRRPFSSKHDLGKETSSKSTEGVPETAPSPHHGDASPSISAPEITPKSNTSTVEDTIARVPAEALPSHREGQRWDFSKRISELMDELLPKIAQVTQKVNTYTGTDYSSIEALRQEIKEQEKLVKARRHAIDEAKHALDSAHAQQASSQKEVVALLERKHSWSATDLERYMSLIRSEHLNDQAVREAKDAVLAAENALEEARSRLEKRERAQYHEEQIWSDTIRRNSTWVTFGLMGVNIFLLLTSLVILEPWRRRRMVREIKTALEAQRPVVEASSRPPSATAIEEAIDEVVEPVGQPAEETDSETTSTSSISVVEPADSALEGANPAQKEVPEPFHTANPVTEPPAPPTPELIEAVAAMDIVEEVSSDMTLLEKITAKINDLKSEDYVSVRKKDFTAAFLAGAALGWATTAFVSLIVSWSR